MLQEAGCGQAPQQLLGLLGSPASQRMQREAQQEQQPEGDCKRMTVQHLPDAATPHRPGRRSWLDAALLLCRIQRPRFSRATLAKGDGQEDIHAHLQEFALPVLECGADEVAGRQVVP